MDECFHSLGPADTQRLAARLVGELLPGSVLALHGTLGTGKTCFVQGLAQALHARDTVSSPSYTLVHEYRADLPIYHVDLYRLRDADEALDIGLDDYLQGAGVTVIEWPERALALLPARTRHLHFETADGACERWIRIVAQRETPC